MKKTLTPNDVLQIMEDILVIRRIENELGGSSYILMTKDTWIDNFSAYKIGEMFGFEILVKRK